MTTTLDLRTINAATEAVVTAMRSAVCQWEQQSQDAAHDGNLSSALMYQNWAFAGDLMAKTARYTLTNLLMDAYDTQRSELVLKVPRMSEAQEFVAP